MEKVSLYYWAGARAAAGVESESVLATTVAEALRAVVDGPGGPGVFPRGQGLFVAGRRGGGPS